MWLKAYEWERAKWPWHQKVRVRSEFVEEFAAQLAYYFTKYRPAVRRTHGHTARGGQTILIFPKGRIRLGTILHEVAHHVNMWTYKGGNEHTGTFRQALIKVYSEFPSAARYAAPKAAALFKLERSAQRRLAEKLNREIERKTATVARKKTLEYKLERVLVRVKKLRTRQKRITTALKSAERSARQYERLIAMRKAPAVAKTETV